jgi:hypothetical protein
VPDSHPLFAVHAPPAVQLQLPAPSQKLFPPQLMPGPTLPVRFVHTGVPRLPATVHEIVPVLHPLVHAPPATHVQPPLVSQ